MKHTMKLALGIAVILAASTALAQNGSDISGPPGGSSVTFAPLPVPDGAGARSTVAGGGSGGAGQGAINSTSARFSAGTPTNSPATGQAIPSNALTAVGNLISGGSPASVASTSSALQNAGAPPGATAQLVQALAALASSTPQNSPALIASAAQAFNNFVANVPASFFASGNLPAQFLAIHAALTPMINAVQ